MSTLRFCVLVGLAIGAVWAFTGVAGAFVTIVLVGLGAGIGYLLTHGLIDLGAIVGRRDDD